MIDHAIGYVRRGWPVFPVNPTTNGPLFRSAHPKGDPLRGACRGECGRVGHGFHDATTDLEVVRQWWTSSPNASIGVPTGIAFDVLDVDRVDFEEGVADLPDCEVIGPSARSGGGWHLFVKPTGLGRVIKFNPSKTCDWLGTDGYVVLPPSRFRIDKYGPDAGNYEWIVTPDEIELHDAPAPLALAVVAAREPAPRMPRASSPPSRTPRSDDDRRPGRWNPAGLIGRLAMAVEGERNDVLNWAAHRIGADVYAGKAQRSEGDHACCELERVAIGVGLGEDETRRTITSGYASGLSGGSAPRCAA